MTVKRLFTRRDFVRAVVEMSQYTASYREAFERVNAEYERLTGHPRYSSYESFRVAKHREQSRVYKRVQMPTLFQEDQ